jgi:aminoglycoside phosphotransferase (APT) family kinase protein
MPANRMPAAEVVVSADLVRRLLARQHPDLADLPLRFLANGWDNVMFRLGQERVVRLPRREIAATIILNEQRWLPGLAGKLPIPIPYPERTGVPADGYPWSWSIVPYLPGSPAADGPPLDPEYAATAIGGFLGALHMPAPPDAPLNPVRGVPLRAREQAFAANLHVVSGIDSDAVLDVWASAIAAPGHAGPPAWVHGDLHPANILVHDGRISGVIDFGDITAGDPAADLSVAWMLLPPRAHGVFRSAYEAIGNGMIDDAMWSRARGWAIALGVMFLAHSADNPQLHAVGHRAVHAALGDLSW